MLLGVNIDHIAVLREARRIGDPDPLDALGICKRAGADQITIHLREDRRHIQDSDARNIIALSPLPVNLECATESSMIDIACRLRPHRVTLVPEKRQEVTTEGGLDVIGGYDKIQKTIAKLHDNDIEVSLFIDPKESIVVASRELGVEWIEFHTGRYANLYAMLYGNLSKTNHTLVEFELPRHTLKEMIKTELHTIEQQSAQAKTMGLQVAAGHGLNMQNVKAICAIGAIEELNIGQSIIARSIFTGLEQAIREMKAILDK